MEKTLYNFLLNQIVLKTEWNNNSKRTEGEKSYRNTHLCKNVNEISKLNFSLCFIMNRTGCHRGHFGQLANLFKDGAVSGGGRGWFQEL